MTTEQKKINALISIIYSKLCFMGCSPAKNMSLKQAEREFKSALEQTSLQKLVRYKSLITEVRNSANQVEQNNFYLYLNTKLGDIEKKAKKMKQAAEKQMANNTGKTHWGGGNSSHSAAVA